MEQHVGVGAGPVGAAVARRLRSVTNGPRRVPSGGAGWASGAGAAVERRDPPLVEEVAVVDAGRAVGHDARTAGRRRRRGAPTATG